MSKKGVLLTTDANLAQIITNDDSVNCLRFNELTGQRVLPDGREFGDQEFNKFFTTLRATYGKFGRDIVDDFLWRVAYEHSFNPIREYLESLPEWDGEPRIETIFHARLGVSDDEYSRAVARLFFAAAVKRVYEPGCKYDYVVILSGAQGIGKSTFVKSLMPNEDWFTDCLSFADMSAPDGKRGAERLQGIWVAELGELTGMRKAEMEMVKAFITRTDDKYRRAYGRVVESHPRSCVFIGTTNEKMYLRDLTGDRRYVPLECHKTEQGANLLSADERDALWAEALALYRQQPDAPLVLPVNLWGTATERQKAAAIELPQLGLVDNYLKKYKEEYVCTAIVFRDVFHPAWGDSCIAKMSKSDSIALGAMIRQCGWLDDGSFKNFGSLGKQRAFYRLKG